MHPLHPDFEKLIVQSNRCASITRIDERTGLEYAGSLSWSPTVEL